MSDSLQPNSAAQPTVVVCGAGAAGIATALSAARSGAHVWLIERRSQIGGTVTHTLIHTLAGLFDVDCQILNDGFASELIERLRHVDDRVAPRKLGRTWVLNVSPQTYARVVAHWIAETSRIRLLLGAHVSSIEIGGDKVESVELATQEGAISIPPNHIVDCTGTAEVIRQVDGGLVDDDANASAGGLIFTLRHVDPEATRFPGSLRAVRTLRTATETGAIPMACLHTWIDMGIAADEVYVKLSVPLRAGWRERYNALLREASRNERHIVNTLRTIPEFQNATVERRGELGIRDGGRIRGEYQLTAADVREGRSFDDSVCRCAWPIEYWHPDHGVQMEYLPRAYDIPLRCLKVAGFENLWAAGKCLSADGQAHASARVVGSCWAMGDGLGQFVAGRIGAKC